MSKAATQPIASPHDDASVAVPPGYKRTQVGVIPEDWGVKTLDDLGAFMKGKGIKRDDVTDDGLACIRYGELYTRYSNYVYSPASRIPESVAQTSQPLKTFDLLFAGSGETAEEIGKCVAYLGEEEAYAGGDIVVLRPVDQNSLYLGHLLNHAVVAEQKARYGQGDAVVHISARNLAMVKLPLPPTTNEQDAIAEALSDVDELIGALETLIAKKRAIKRAAMQQLLTGTTRLPGFTGEWEEKQIGGFVSIRNQKVIPASVDPNTPCVELEHIGQNNGRLLGYSSARYSTSSKYRFFKGDILFGRLRSYLRKFWHSDRDGICTTEIWPLMVDSDQACSGFLRGIVETERFIEAASIAYGTHMPRADWKVVRELKIGLPKIEEQTAIATALSDMDVEIEALDRRRDKTKQIKQGMMQELLTGRIRLIKGES